MQAESKWSPLTRTLVVSAITIGLAAIISLVVALIRRKWYCTSSGTGTNKKSCTQSLFSPSGGAPGYDTQEECESSDACNPPSPPQQLAWYCTKSGSERCAYKARPKELGVIGFKTEQECKKSDQCIRKWFRTAPNSTSCDAFEDAPYDGAVSHTSFGECQAQIDVTPNSADSMNCSSKSPSSSVNYGNLQDLQRSDWSARTTVATML